jgi:CheY-like chemotaxis protein
LARKILLADDSVTAQNMGRKILADAGYEVITVNNGSAALKKIAETKPDLIVLDVYMPGYSGLEVCQRLKEVKETARIPVLLTVGKLEPFKPEECKRVRAEGYIVKPFEASELLSALSKLEDRVVPRSESSKPGRFARAIAAVEEGRGDEAAEANDSENGWKNRIVFPSKKKKKQEEDDSEIYNPGNRDLRTTVERPTPQRESASRNDDRLDVAALAASAGLPKDVTPEELAALAAAAAQVQAAVDGRESAAAFGEPDRAEAKSAEATMAPPPQAIPETGTRAEEKVETKIETKTESQHEAEPVSHASQPEAAAEVPAGATFAGQSVEETTTAVSASAGRKDAKHSTPVRDFDVIATPTAQAEGSAIAIIQGEAGSGNGSGRSQKETEKKEIKEIEEKRAAEDQGAAPVTMTVAAAAGSGFVAAGSTTHRWVAVPVAIAAEESAVSLELEMQKAYAAFAAAEANQPGFVVSPRERTPAVENSISSRATAEAPANSAPADLATPNLAPNEDEIARTLRDVANASAEAVDSALAQLEAVAEARINPAPAAAQIEEASSEPVPLAEAAQNAMPQENPAPQAAASVPSTETVALQSAAPAAEKPVEPWITEAKPEPAASVMTQDIVVPELAQSQEKDRETQAWQENAAERPTERAAAEVQASESQDAGTTEESVQFAAAPAPYAAQSLESDDTAGSRAPSSESSTSESSTSESTKSESKSESWNSESSRPEPGRAEPPVPAVAQEVPKPSASMVTSTQESSSVYPLPEVFRGPALRKENIAGGEMAENRENDLAATTAAAWASWRQIRESGDGKKATGSSKASTQDDDDDEYPAPSPDTAAMAVAAGAEKAPEEAPEASADDPAAIASIVDKVLADLRPKIAEEISKKLKKK